MGSRGNAKAGRQLWLTPGEGERARGLVADVAVTVRSWNIQAYAVPEALRATLGPGVLVEVPYGRRGAAAGVCVRVSEQDYDHTLPPVGAVTSPRALLTERLIELGLWVSEYYAWPPGLTLAGLVPAAARQVRRRSVAWVRRTGAEAGELTGKQRRLLEVLGEEGLPRGVALERAGVGSAVLGRLVAQGLVERLAREEVVVPAAPNDEGAEAAGSPPACPEDGFELTAAQATSLGEIQAAVAQGGFAVSLLFGVPGSGKTEVYVRAIREAIGRGRQAILLVPEIALATQVVARLVRRFERVAVLHSRLSERVRRDTFQAVAAGTVDVVIGTRSAVFAPCARLGLIVVDEEQDGSFKSLSAPWLHARDVAIKRGQVEQVPVVLGSATPALETWHNAHTLGRYRLLQLPERVGTARLPEVRVVDRAQYEPGSGVLSEELAEALRETLAASQQALLLHNRRGYAPHLRCRRCGLAVSCPRCGVALVYHQADEQMRCHHCSVRQDVPRACLDETCGGRLERVGLAIQRLEEQLVRMFPAARCLRLDSDTMRRREDYAKALEAFEAGAADILVGTQMVAKGLDFPGVRLVGVIDADAALALPDFRGGERGFQGVWRGGGRGGGREGSSLAIVQCADADAPAVRHALRMDYAAFAEVELAVRRRLGYPPFTRLARLVLGDARPGRARTEAGRVAEELRALAGSVNPRIAVGSALACFMPRRRTLLRFEVLIRGPRDGSVSRLLREAGARKLLSPRVQRFRVDVDPIDLL